MGKILDRNLKLSYQTTWIHEDKIVIWQQFVYRYFSLYATEHKSKYVAHAMHNIHISE